MTSRRTLSPKPTNTLAPSNTPRATPPPFQPLPPRSVDARLVSVGGLTAGAYLATQIQVALSSRIMGAAILGGGPYYCAENSLTLATTTCVSNPSRIDTNRLVTFTQDFYKLGYIDSPQDLSNDRVYIFSGTEDTTVLPGVVKKLEDYYRALNVSNVKTEYTVAAGHCVPTISTGVACYRTLSPYINNCAYDGAGEALNHIYGRLAPHTTQIGTNLVEFDMREFVSRTPESIGLSSKAFAYVPLACRQANAMCALHVSFHGCSQSFDIVGNAYVLTAGYNEWAESNKIIIVYPQAAPTFSSPLSCFDWWGHTGTNYAYKTAPQIDTVSRLISFFVNGSTGERHGMDHVDSPHAGCHQEHQMGHKGQGSHMQEQHNKEDRHEHMD